MKIEVEATNFNLAVGTASRAVSLRPTTPVLNNILIEAQEGGVKVTGTNLDTTVGVWVPAKVIEKGETTAPARVLGELMSNIKEDKATIELDKETLNIRTNKINAKIPTIAAAEFPRMAQNGESNKEKISKAVFMEAIGEVKIAASQDESRPVLTGIMFKPGGKGATLVSTDGYRLAKKEVPIPLKEEVILSARDLGELAKIAALLEEDYLTMEVSADTNQVGFTIGNTEYSTKVIAGDFPSFEQIIPKDFVSTVILEKQALLDSIKVASTFAKDLGNVVHFTFEEKKTFVSASSNNTGEGKIILDANVSGQPINIAFNSRFITESVASLSSNKVEVRFAGPVNPALIKPESDDSLIYIVMPVRTQS